MLSKFTGRNAHSCLQNERAEQLRSTSFLAAIMLSFSVAALYQLNFTVTAFPGVLNILYALTVALTVRYKRSFLPRMSAA